MSELETLLNGKQLAQHTNEQLRIALGAALYTNTAEMWSAYLQQQGYSGSVADMMARWWDANSVPLQFRNYISSGLYIDSFSPSSLFVGGFQGWWYDFSDMSTLFQDSAGATPVTAVEQPIGRVLDKSGNGNHSIQATGSKKPTLSARKNWLLATATMSTQNVTTQATPYTLTHTGTGTITLSGTSTAGPLVGAGTLTFTPTAGTLTLTVSGTVTDAQIEFGSTATRYQRVTTASDYDTVGFPHYARFDGVDDALGSAASVDFTAGDALFCSIGLLKYSDAVIAGVVELSVDSNANNGAFTIRAPSSPTTARYYSSVRGSVQNGISTSLAEFDAFDINVLSGVYDISADQHSLRIAGAEVANSGGADLGTGNFGNYPFYHGSRAGTGLYFNGSIGQSVAVFKNASANEITNSEAFISKKLGLS